MRQIGDAWFVASAQQLRAVAARGLGDLPDARARFAEAVTAFAELGDDSTLAEVLEDIAVLTTRAGQHTDAVELVAAASRMRDDVGSPLTEALEATVRTELQPSLEAIGPIAAAAATDRGGSLDRTGAIDLALSVCSVEGDP